MTLANSTSTTRRIRKTGKGCRGAKAVRGVDRGAAMVLMRKRKKLCKACGQRNDENGSEFSGFHFRSPLAA